MNLASVKDVDHAVAVAKAAYAEWRKSPLSRRTEILFKLRDLIDANRERLAEIISTENGKTLADARGEVARGLENVEFACGIPALLKGGYSEQASTRCGCVSDSAAAGRGGGDYAVQFSGDGADVDVCECDCVRQYVHSEAVGEGSFGEPAAGGAGA